MICQSKPSSVNFIKSILEYIVSFLKEKCIGFSNKKTFKVLDIKGKLKLDMLKIF